MGTSSSKGNATSSATSSASGWRRRASTGRASGGRLAAPWAAFCGHRPFEDLKVLFVLCMERRGTDRTIRSRRCVFPHPGGACSCHMAPPGRRAAFSARFVGAPQKCSILGMQARISASCAHAAKHFSDIRYCRKATSGRCPLNGSGFVKTELLMGHNLDKQMGSPGKWGIKPRQPVEPIHF